MDESNQFISGVLDYTSQKKFGKRCETCFPREPPTRVACEMIDTLARDTLATARLFAQLLATYEKKYVSTG